MAYIVELLKSRWCKFESHPAPYPLIAIIPIACVTRGPHFYKKKNFKKKSSWAPRLRDLRDCRGSIVQGFLHASLLLSRAFFTLLRDALFSECFRSNTTVVSGDTLGCHVVKGHFTHEPRAVTMKLWEPKRKCPKVVPTHFQDHVLWSRTLKCSVKPYVTGSSTKRYFNECLFMHVLSHDKIE